MAWEVVGKKVAHGGGRISYMIRMARYENGIVSLSLSRDLLKMMRWVEGDKVHLLVDRDENLIGIKRTTDFSGRSLTFAGARDSKIAIKGKLPTSLVFRARVDDAVTPRVVGEEPRFLFKDDLVIDEDQNVVAFAMLD
jgi:hypothetical protein